MAVRRIEILPHQYYDSWLLMKISSELSEAPGVLRVGTLMGSERNIDLLVSGHLLEDRKLPAGAADLIIVVEAESEGDATRAIESAKQKLKQSRFAGGRRVASFAQALQILPQANLALISLPGEYAGEIAATALQKGLHVFLFSDHVPLETERHLKQEADRRGLLLMGPGCGTAYFQGKGLGFANRIRPGSVGIVGAAGTGIQELMVHLHRAGLGVSQAIGTGGRDLSAVVGGITTRAGLRLLAADPSTQAIVLIAKPSDTKVVASILSQGACMGKPLFAVLLGQLGEDSVRSVNFPVPVYFTIESVLGPLLQSVGHGQEYLVSLTAEENRAQTEALQLASRMKPLLLRGGYTGGSLAAEAILVMQQEGIWPESNVQLRGVMPVSVKREAHRVIDFGAEEYTENRAHPMANPIQRNQWLHQNALEQPQAHLLLADVVLGFGCHPNPAQVLTDALTPLGQRPLQIASVCGVEEDSQGYSRQKEILRRAGFILAPSNAAAARIAARCIVMGNR